MALYLAITRATHTIYWIESVVDHPFFESLNLQSAQLDNALAEKPFLCRNWQREMEKLEQQDLFEEAELIKTQCLQEKPSAMENSNTHRNYMDQA